MDTCLIYVEMNLSFEITIQNISHLRKFKRTIGGHKLLGAPPLLIVKNSNILAYLKT